MIFNIGKIAENIALKFGFRLERINSPTTKNKAAVTDSTIESFQQAQQISNVQNYATSADHVSDLEIKILRELYNTHKETGCFPRINVHELHAKIGIKEGDYIGTVNDSEFIKIDSDDYVIREAGIRFMDGYVRSNKPEVDIMSLAHSGGSNGQELTGLRLVNNGSGSAIGIECSLCADGLACINFGNVDRINPNNESRNSLGFRYSDTPYFTQPLDNLRMVFEYKNKDGFAFVSGRYLRQQKRADGNYNILNAPLGEYFEN